MLPPTSPDLALPATRPYFLWWTDLTVADFRRELASPDPDGRAYWMGTLLREANTRDVWLFVTLDEVRALWPRLVRHLGRARERWAWLLGLEAIWPPPEARRASTLGCEQTRGTYARSAHPVRETRTNPTDPR